MLKKTPAVHTRSALTLLVACGLMAGAACPAAGQVSYDIFAFTGQPVDVQLELREASFPRLNDAGHVLFMGSTAIDSPVNSVCDEAIEIQYGYVTLGNSYVEFDASQPSCWTQDAWFRFTAPRTETLMIERECRGSTLPSHRIQVYTTGCAAIPPANNTCFETWTGVVTEGQTYYLRLGGTNINGTPAVGTSTYLLEPLGSATTRRRHLARLGNMLFINKGNGHEPVLREGDVTTFDPALSYRGLSLAALGNNDDIVLPAVTWQASEVAVGTAASLVSGSVDGPVVQEQRDLLLGGPPAPRWTVPVPQLTIDGQTAYTENAGDVMRIGSREIRRLDLAPGFPAGSMLDVLEQPVLAGRAFAFRARRVGVAADTNNFGVWVGRIDTVSDGLTLVARLGDQAPRTETGVVFGSLPSRPALNDNGEVALVAALAGTGITTENNAGVWRSGTGGQGGLEIVARKGDPVAGVDGAVFASFSQTVSMNRRGDLVVRGALSGMGVDSVNNTGVWMSQAGVGGGDLHLIAREGEPAPGLPTGVVYASFGEPVLGAAGDVVFSARVRGEGVGRTNNDAVFLRTRDGRVRVVARRGDTMMIPGPGGGGMVEKTVFMVQVTRETTSASESLNFSGQALVTVEFTDATQALLLTSRFCAADWDHSGSVTSEDFFAFIDDYLRVAADLNRDGYSNSQDFFDFIVAFFEPCE